MIELLQYVTAGTTRNLFQMKNMNQDGDKLAQTESNQSRAFYDKGASVGL